MNKYTGLMNSYDFIQNCQDNSDLAASGPVPQPLDTYIYIYISTLIEKILFPHFIPIEIMGGGTNLLEIRRLHIYMHESFFKGEIMYQDIPLDKSGTLLIEAQLAVESLRARFSTEEVDEGLHLILTTTTLENGVAVTTALGRIHGLGGKDGVEHVGTIDLRASMGS